MSISKKVTEIKEPLETDLQLMATELDTSVTRMLYISSELLTDAIAYEAFEKMLNDIRYVSGIEVMSFDDNTIQYYYYNMSVVIHETIGETFIVFVNDNSRKIESKLESFRMVI